MRQREMLGDVVLAQRQAGIGMPRRCPRSQRTIDRLGDVPAAAIIGCDGQRHAGVVARGGLGVEDQLAQTRLESRPVADDPEAHAVLVQARHLLLDRGGEQFHQR